MSDGFRAFTDEPGVPILVEGQRDEKFLQELIRGIDGEYAISERGGDTKVFKALDVLVSVQIPRIGVILDVDDRSREEVYQQCYNKLDGNYSNVSELDNDGIAVGDTSVVHVGYSGLPEDSDIADLSIERYAVEDHVLKLLLNDDDTVQRISESEINDSSSLKSAIVDIERELEEYYGTLRRGKVHLEIAKITLGYESRTGAFIYDLLQCTDIDYETHDSTAPLLSVFGHLNGY